MPCTFCVVLRSEGRVFFKGHLDSLWVVDECE